MTPTEYLDEVRFPLTTQVANRLTARGQIEIDSFNLGVMRDGVGDGRILTSEELARFQELEAKSAFWAEVWAQGV
jgi:hypothetical protein